MSYTYDQLYAYNGELLAQLDALSAKLAKLEGRYLMDTAAAGRVVDLLSDKVRELRAENSDMSAALNTADTLYHMLITDNAELRAEHEALRAAHQELLCMCASVNSTQAAKRRELREIELDLSKQLDALRLENAALREQCDALNAVFDVAMQQAAGRRAGLREIERDEWINALRAANSDLSKRYNTLFEQRQVLRSNYDELSGEFHRLHTKYDALCAENALLRDRLRSPG